MDQNIWRATVGGIALGGLIGGAGSWIGARFIRGLRPLVFLGCGVYAGAVYGGIVGAVRAAQQETAYELAVNRAQRR
jgi:hypothetical protein